MQNHHHYKASTWSTGQLATLSHQGFLCAQQDLQGPHKLWFQKYCEQEANL